jgi:hypothetical protein
VRYRRHAARVPVPATARWTAQQAVGTFALDAAPRLLIRHHDGSSGEDFPERIKHMGIEEVVITYRSP